MNETGEEKVYQRASCPQCEGEIDVPVELLGKGIDCPLCFKRIAVAIVHNEAAPLPPPLPAMRPPPIPVAQADPDAPLRCPKCFSTQLSANKTGFGLKGAAVGGVLLGGVGLLAGLIGTGKIKITCLRCAHVFQPGQAK